MHEPVNTNAIIESIVETFDFYDLSENMKNLVLNSVSQEEYLLSAVTSDLKGNMKIHVPW